MITCTQISPMYVNSQVLSYGIFHTNNTEPWITLLLLYSHYKALTKPLTQPSNAFLHASIPS